MSAGPSTSSVSRSPAGPGGGPARTLVVSSSEVYGKGSKNPFSEDDDVVYGATTIARWCYGCSKAIDEYLAMAHHKQHGLPAVIVRLFNTVGPGQVGEFGMVVPRFVRAAIDGKDLEIYGDGTQTRCFCDVRDIVDAMPRLLASPACYGRVFNLGSDRAMSIATLAKAVVNVVGSGSGVRHVPYAQAYAPGFEDLKDRRPDLSRIKSAIGWEPTRALEDTIRDVAASIRAEGSIERSKVQGIAGASR